MQYKNLTLDTFQKDAIKAINKNKSVVVSAPTGSGKTLIADYIIDRDLKQDRKVIYTAPIKALSNQKFKDFTKDYGHDKIGLLTGDVVKNPTAPILIMTTEIYRNMVLANDPLINDISYVVFDEIHFINDIERGTVWEESVIFSPDHIRFLCLSATIPNADEFASWIKAIKNHEVVVVRHDIRSVPLQKNLFDTQLGITTIPKLKQHVDIPDYQYVQGRKRIRSPRVEPPNHVDLVREIKNKTPCMFFTFSRAGCEKHARELAKARLFPRNKDIPHIINDILKKAPSDINQLKTTRLLKQTLPVGIAFHHAGLLPVLKEIVEELFSKGLINVLYATETFAVGINMPAKTVCFESLRKFDGISFRMLNSKEFFQIAGRAGRRGIDKKGFVFSMIDRRDFEEKTLRKIMDKDVEPIKSQFRLSVNTVLNLIKNHDEKEIQEILCKSFDSYQKYGAQYLGKNNIHAHNAFKNITKNLIKLKYTDGKTLTQKGEFSSKIYADEILLGEIFATDLYKNFSIYQILLIIASLCFEPRENTRIFKKFPKPESREIFAKLKNNAVLSAEKRFRNIRILTGLIYPLINNADFFDILPNSNLTEGDILRFFRQILDRIGQIKMATQDYDLIAKLENCALVIARSIEDVDGL